jgi:hypothetical protein
VPNSSKTARPWQSQAEEKAKEAEGLRTSLADKAAALATTEEQLRQEQVARQQVEAHLQQERAVLIEAWAALERERLAHDEVLGRLQQECTALEGAQATLKQRDDEVSKLNGELVQLSVSLADARLSLEEQETTVLSLQQAAEDARQALEVEKKQFEGELRSAPFRSPIWLARDPLPTFVSLSLVFRPADRPEEYDHPGRGCADGLQLLSTGVGGVAGRRLEVCQEVEEGEAQAGSSLASHLRALGGHVSQRMRRALHLGVKKALGVVASHYQVDFEVVSSGCVVPVGVEDEVAMDRADALAATAADMLAEDFTDFLLPDAPAAGGPQT